MLEYLFSGITLHFKILIWLTIIILIHKYISHPSREIAGDRPCIPFCIEYQILYSPERVLYSVSCWINVNWMIVVKSFNLFKIRANIKWTHYSDSIHSSLSALLSPRIFSLIYCCCVSIIFVICICPPGALIWLIKDEVLEAFNNYHSIYIYSTWDRI
jgi:hypothetical protein